MSEAISNIIHKKLEHGFKTKFLSRKKFETDFALEQNSLIESLDSLTKSYLELRRSENPDVVKIRRLDYILEQFNNRNRKATAYTIDEISELKVIGDRYYSKYEEEYNRCLNDENYIVPLIDFIVDRTTEIISSEKEQSDLSIKYLFWDYFHNKYLNTSWHTIKTLETKITESPELIVKKFQEKYLSNIYLKLLDIAERNISDETISPFDKIVINVGRRSYEYGRAGWSTTRFQILNNDKEYEFSYSAKDEKKVEGECINIFIFQTKYLIKISVTLDEVERTPYIIHRDCEKVSLKNDCELVIAKHHGNETIVFDTRKDALTMQTKLLEIREGRYKK